MNRLFVLIISLVFCLSAHTQPVELLLWHSMAGQLGDEVRIITEKFNKTQNEYKVIPVYKGNYVETLTSFAAAYRAHQPPAMVQIYEVGTALMISPPGVIKPVDELMREQGIPLPKEDFIQAVREFYSRDGQLMAMPFNLSVPVVYANLDILKKVGYTNENLPVTWDEIEVLAEKLKKEGYHCAFTSAYPGWILFESYLAIHGLPITQDNPKKAIFNTPQLQSHLQRLKRWYDLHYFRYGGRADDATILFTSQECPLFAQSSGAYNSLAQMVPFRLGITLMPLDDKFTHMRHANVAGGAALWTIGGQSEKLYKGIAQFYAFIAKPEIQMQWHERTGYLPIGLKGIYAHILEANNHPALALALVDLENNFAPATGNYSSPQNQIRIIYEQILEALFAGTLTVDEALQQAINRSNLIILRFARNTQI
ncbi:MAG TPA: extracellular solute-binding protein [Legionella sp.]|nr:extracellular solute-binding protein [Legionella sp.]